MADSVCGNRPRPINTTRRRRSAVTRCEVVAGSAPQPGTEKSSLADTYTEHAPPTSSPEHGSPENPESSCSSTSTPVTPTATSSSISTMTTSALSSTPAHISYLFIAASSRCMATSSTSYLSLPPEGINNSFTTATIRFYSYHDYKLMNIGQKASATPSSQHRQTSSPSLSTWLATPAILSRT